MPRSAHTSDHAATCPACITSAERQRMPWHADYLDTIARVPAIERKHAQVRARQEREAARKALGITFTD